MSNKLQIIRTGFFGVNTLIVPLQGNKCFVVDPAGCAASGDQNAVTDYLKTKKLDCAAIVLTHSHFDHITGIAAVKAAFPGAKIAIHEKEIGELACPPGPMGEGVIRFFGDMRLMDEVAKQPPADVALRDGCTLEDAAGKDCGAQDWRVILTPGHTPGSICLYNSKEKILISGDTLFAWGGYGRTDMPGGDEVQIMKSLELLKKIIPEGTHVYPGHDQDFVY